MVGEDGAPVATSILHASRSDCLRSIAELKVEGPAASVAYDDSGDGLRLGVSRGHG